MTPNTWDGHGALASWRDWWEDKEIAKGQTASEMFLWALSAAQVDKLNSLLENVSALAQLKVRFNRAVDEALDAYCAQLRYQDTISGSERLLMDASEMSAKFFPHFADWIGHLIGQKGVSLQVSKHRQIAALVGAAYSAGINASGLGAAQWTNVVEFIRRPQEIGRKFGTEWPVSKGRWDGKKGYRAQLQAARDVVGKLCE